MGGIDLQLGSRVEEDIGSGFGATDLIGGGDGVEEVGEADGVEGMEDIAARPAGGDGDGGPVAFGLAGKADNRFDGQDILMVFGVVLILGGDDGGGVNLEGMDLIPVVDGLLEGHAGDGHEGAAIEAEGSAGSGEAVIPCAEVERHGVGEGTIAIKDIGLVGFGGRVE